MSDPPDLATLARRYMDLWQEHLGSMARDPAVSDALARAFSLMTQGLADGGPARADGAGPRQPAAGDHATSDQHSEPDSKPDPVAGESGTSAGAAPAGPAPGHAGPADDELASRVDGLERRVAILEAALGGLLAGATRGRPGD
ncbi:hypothetical protein [Roseospira visakhapatnamensis]|uniref:Uncharacterized protein n=1 Tax=Roseospira visakhapatnamensis TaxID=390880 RepID=A0A7W6W945_9PROT|nr:hypothetical protein [Roseospira visakhapatnamensis]MBB4265052.1 hypothetical protein [Roseospira visakhapatnamensis]